MSSSPIFPPTAHWRRARSGNARFAQGIDETSPDEALEIAKRRRQDSRARLDYGALPRIPRNKVSSSIGLPSWLRCKPSRDAFGGALSPWQQSLLRTALLAGAIACIGAPILAAVSSGYVAVHYVVAVVCGIWQVVALLRRWEGRRTVAIAYVAQLFVLIAATGFHSAWNPTVVVSLCYLVVAGGLLLGHRAVYVIVGCSFVALELGAIGVHFGLHRVPLTGAYDPRNAGNWLRLSIVVLTLVSAAAWVLRFAVGAAGKAAASAQGALRTAHEQRLAAERLRPARMEQERRIRDSQKLQMVAQLGDGFAHVLNNLLTVVHCACEDLKRASSHVAVKEAATSIRDASVECAARTRELLSLSRPHAAEAASVRLDEFIASLQPVLSARTRSNVAIAFDIEPACPVRMPPSWAEQIVTNLLLNAEQAMPDGGMVRVATRTLASDQRHGASRVGARQGAYAALIVTDDGVGVTEDIAERACEPFFSTKSRAKHAGLGLTLVHDMVRQLGGTIQLRALEKGTQVTIELPSAEDNLPPERSSFADWPSRKGGDGRYGSDDCETAPLPRVSEGDSQAVPGTATERSTTNSGAAASHGQGQPARLSSSVGEGSCVVPDVDAPFRDWRVKALNEFITIEIVGAAFLTAVMAASLRGLFPIVGGGSVVCLLLLVRVIRRCTYDIRLWMTLSVTLGLAVLAVARGSYLGPTAVGGLVLAVFIASVFGSPLATVLSCIAVALGLGLSGWLWSTGHVDAPLDEYVGDSAVNWARIAFVMPTIASVVGAAVLRVFSLVESHVAALRSAREELERSRETYQAETDAILKLEEARSRSARVEAGGRLTGMIAHDLNNSMACILGWAEYLSVVKQPEHEGEALKAIVQSADYAETLVQQMQRHSDVVHRGESIDAGRLLARARPMLEATVQQRRSDEIALELRCDEGCFVEIREHSLRRLLLNLLSNARDACGTKGRTCSVNLARCGGEVVLSVSDDGCGIDADTRARLFEPFFTTKGKHGTGLGLHSVAEIVRGTGGRIDVGSEPGVGTCVTIRWPLALPTPQPEAASVPMVQCQGAERVLLADDNDSVRRLLGQGLVRAGYSVVEARDGDEAILAVETMGPFDALCTDAVMPGSPITELIRRFAVRYPDRPRVVISGYLPEELSTQLAEYPGTIVLAKPFTHVQLVSTLSGGLTARVEVTDG